jgi:peptidyl-prolyl cis-trans isomerase D
MLQKIRDRISGWFATVFLSAIAIVFVFWGIKFEGTVSSAAARVNGESISIDKVRRAWQERQVELQREIRDELPAELVRSEQSALLDGFVRRELLRQRTGELGYRVGDQKLVETLNSIPALQVDGRFSRDRYAALLRQQGRSEAAFEADLREDLQINELQRGIAISSFVTPAELRRRTELEGEQRDVDFVVIPASAFEPAKGPTDAEVERWFEAKKSRFVTPETVALQYVDLTLDSVAAEVSVSEERCTSITTRSRRSASSMPSSAGAATSSSRPATTMPPPVRGPRPAQEGAERCGLRRFSPGKFRRHRLEGARRRSRLVDARGLRGARSPRRCSRCRRARSADW